MDIYENTNYIPMGYTYDYYCTEQQLEALSKEDRARIMLDTLVVGEKEASYAASFLQPWDGDAGPGELEESAAERRAFTCEKFTGTSSGFTAAIDLPKENIVFFSIPSDPGWRITVNGEPARMMEVQYGLMGLVCPEGHSEIAAVYHTNGITLGLACTLLCAAIWLLIVRREKTLQQRVRKGSL